MEAALATDRFDWTLGDRIRKARRVAGMSHAQLAAALTERGFPSTAGRVGAWETGKQPRQIERILAEVSEITGAPLDWLLGLRTGNFSSLALVAPIFGQMSMDFEAIDHPVLTGV